MERDHQQVQVLAEQIEQEDYQKAIKEFFKEGSKEEDKFFKDMQTELFKVSQQLKMVLIKLDSENDDEQKLNVITKNFSDIISAEKNQPLQKNLKTKKLNQPLYFVNEKHKVFKYFDFQANQICQKPIEAQNGIPVFSGIGSVSGRVFMFGGKDYQKRNIVNKAYELEWTKDDRIVSTPINRMFMKRSRSTVTGI